MSAELDPAKVKPIVESSIDELPKSESPSPAPRASVPFFRSTVFQAWVLFGVFFCGPGMYSALNSLGAGGLRDPTLVNITSGMSYGMNTVFALLTGVFLNLLGVKLVLSLGVVGFSLNGAALYCNNRFRTQWFLYFSSAVQGFCTALLWVAQAAIMLAYPEADFKGRFISIWYASIASGQAVGGAISLGFNVARKDAGKISPTTYIPLIAISVCGPFIALLISSPRKVIRRDGVPVKTAEQPGFVQELKRIFSALQNKQILLLVPLFVYSQWFLSYNGTFTTVYHSVRGRALTSFVGAFTGILGTFSMGYVLDKVPLPRSKRFKIAYFGVYTLATIHWIWQTVVQWYYAKTHPVGLDWKDGEFYASFLLLLYFSFVDHAFQTFMYALIGTLSDEVDELARFTGLMKAINTGGAALGYGVQVKWSMVGSEAILLVLWFLQIVPTWFVVRRVTDVAT